MKEERKQIRIYYGSGTGGRCCVCTGQTLSMHSPDGGTFLKRIYFKNNPAECHPDLIWSDEDLGVFWSGHPNKKKKTTRRTRWVAIWDEVLIQNEHYFYYCTVCTTQENLKHTKHARTSRAVVRNVNKHHTNRLQRSTEEYKTVNALWLWRATHRVSLLHGNELQTMSAVAAAAAVIVVAVAVLADDGGVFLVVLGLSSTSLSRSFQMTSSLVFVQDSVAPGAFVSAGVDSTHIKLTSLLNYLTVVIILKHTVGNGSTDQILQHLIFHTRAVIIIIPVGELQMTDSDPILSCGWQRFSVVQMQ